MFITKKNSSPNDPRLMGAPGVLDSYGLFLLCSVSWEGQRRTGMTCQLPWHTGCGEVDALHTAPLLNTTW